MDASLPSPPQHKFTIYSLDSKIQISWNLAQSDFLKISN